MEIIKIMYSLTFDSSGFWVSTVLLYKASSSECGSYRQKKILHKFFVIFFLFHLTVFSIVLYSCVTRKAHSISSSSSSLQVIFSPSLSLSHREGSVVLCAERTVIREQFGSISFSSIITVFPA